MALVLLPCLLRGCWMVPSCYCKDWWGYSHWPPVWTLLVLHTGVHCSQGPASVGAAYCVFLVSGDVLASSASCDCFAVSFGSSALMAGFASLDGSWDIWQRPDPSKCLFAPLIPAPSDPLFLLNDKCSSSGDSQPWIQILDMGILVGGRDVMGSYQLDAGPIEWTSLKWGSSSPHWLHRGLYPSNAGAVIASDPLWETAPGWVPDDGPLCYMRR